MRSNFGHGIVRALLLVGSALVSACGGGGGGGDSESAPQPSQSPSPARAVAQTDAEIARLVYSDERTPAGFYEDTTVPVTGYVATSHLKNSDLAASSAGSAAHELCTDDWNQAMQWSEDVAAAAPTYADLVATDSNSRFFEFGRVPRGQVGAYLRSRVYKCAYLDRANVNLQAIEGAAGRFNRRPFSASDLRELSEYLWLFSTFNNFGNAVLKSSGSTGSAMSHTLHIATLTRAPGTGGCDRIDVIEWSHAANAQDGELQRSRRTLWSFGAREVGAAVEICAL
jgi:hypothetical protein